MQNTKSPMLDVGSNQAPPSDGPTYLVSTKIEDVGGASDGNPKPSAPFVNPDPKSIHNFSGATR
jgi:hypothetical protein